jgi:hypothetical protein
MIIFCEKRRKIFLVVLSNVLLASLIISDLRMDGRPTYFSDRIGYSFLQTA